MSDKRKEREPDRALRLLVGAAATVVLLAGIKGAGDVLMPMVLSGFLSIAALPAVRWLTRRKVPSPLAIAIVVSLAAALLLAVTSVVAGSVRSFTREIDRYEPQLDALTAQIIHYASTLGIPFDGAGDLTEFVTPAAVMDLVGQTLNGLVRLLGGSLIVVVTMTFTLFEASQIAQKFRLAFGHDPETDGPFAHAGSKVQRYLLIKSLISLLTGLLAGLSCWLIGVDFWLLWGLLAFLLNYIPSIGPILAAIPPVLLAAVQLGWPAAAECAVAYTIIHILLANLLEPPLLGQGLGLSPLVVFLSLIFWGWMWGPAGMLLCVPMTAMVQLVLDSAEETHWIAVFLGSPHVIRRQNNASMSATLPGPPDP